MAEYATIAPLSSITLLPIALSQPSGEEAWPIIKNARLSYYQVFEAKVNE